MKKAVSILALILLLCAACLAQSPATTTTSAPSTAATTVTTNSATAAAAATTVAVENLQLPTYLAAGAAYDQAVGSNFFFSAIVPVANQSGVYEATTTDLFPSKTVYNGKTVYSLSPAIRQSIHKQLYNDQKNVLLVGGGVGVAFAQATAPATGSSAGVTGEVTVTYVRQLSTHFAFMVPTRAVYLPNVGWYPIVQAAFVFKPGGN